MLSTPQEKILLTATPSNKILVVGSGPRLVVDALISFYPLQVLFTVPDFETEVAK